MRMGGRGLASASYPASLHCHWCEDGHVWMPSPSACALNGFDSIPSAKLGSGPAAVMYMLPREATFSQDLKIAR